MARSFYEVLASNDPYGVDESLNINKSMKLIWSFKYRCHLTMDTFIISMININRSFSYLKKPFYKILSFHVSNWTISVANGKTDKRSNYDIPE